MAQTEAQKAAAAKKRAEAKAAKQTQAAPAAEPRSIFDQAVGFVLKDRIEGGYVNDPRDPGGETNFGISKRSYPRVNMKTLTREQAIAIYKRDYWDSTGCDELPPKVAVAVFDCAVNQGPAIAKRLLQKAAGTVADGIIGPKTLAAVKSADQEDLVVQYLGWRLRRYAFTANSSTYMRGWSNRVLYLLSFLSNELELA